MSSYTHTEKAGNQGDVAKHLMLIESLDFVTKNQRQEGGQFWYFDVHAARAQYQLPSDGDWRFGVGKLTGLGTEQGPIDTYFRLAFLDDPGFGRQYLGSSSIAFTRISKAVLKKPWMTLCDIDGEVGVDLQRYFSVVQNSSPVLISQAGASEGRLKKLWNNLGDQRTLIIAGNGYLALGELLESGEKPSFVLLDPPTVRKDRKSLEPLLSELSKKQVPFMCWTPIMSNAKTDHGWFEALSIDSAAFLAYCRSRFLVAVVLWQRPGGNQAAFGCQLTFSNAIDAHQLRSACNALKNSFDGWEAEIVDRSVV